MYNHFKNNNLCLIILLIFIFYANSIILNAKFIEIEIENIHNIRPKIAIAMSGGGARGISQIGILKELEKQNIKIDYITGTSIGAILGSFYATGYSVSQIEEIVKSLDWEEINSIGKATDRSELFYDQKSINDRSILSFRFNNFKFIVPEAISIGTKFTYFLNYILWNAPYQPLTSFDDLKYPFRAISTDVIQGESVTFKGGNLATIVRASSTLPLRYTPVRYDNKILVDGGIFANIPAKQAEEFSPDYIIAFNTTSPLLVTENINTPWSLADQIVSIQMKKFEQNSVKSADLIISPELINRKNTDFNQLDTIIFTGEVATKNHIQQINNKIISFRDSVINFNLKAIENIDYSKIKYHCIGLFEEDENQIYKSNINNFKDFTNIIKSFQVYNKINFVYNPDDSLLIIKGKKYKIIKDYLINCNDEFVANLVSDTLNILIKNNQFFENQCNEIKEVLLNYLINKGLNLSIINVNVKNNLFNIEINTPKLNDIFISGNQSTNEKLILRHLKLKIGDYVNAEKLARSWEDVFNTNFFSSADFQILRNNYNASADLYISLKEIGSQAINLGLQINESKKTRIGIDLLEENLFNAGMRVNFRFVAGEREILNDLSLEQPRLYSTLFTYKLQAYYQYRRKYSYEINNEYPNHKFNYLPLKDLGTQVLGLKFAVGSQIKKSGRIAIESRFEKQRYYIWDLERKDKSNFYNINTIKFDANFDTENKHYFPRSGNVINLSLETNLFNLQNNVSFSKAIFLFKSNHSVKNFTFSPILSFGFSDRTTPYPEFFDLSQGAGFFGILEGQEIGRQMAKLQMDFRYKFNFKIFFDTYLSIRYDFGSVWLMPEQIKISSLKHGIGTALQLDTPIGPAVFSIGKSFKFTKNPDLLVLGPLAFYYSIGINL